MRNDPASIRLPQKPNKICKSIPAFELILSSTWFKCDERECFHFYIRERGSKWWPTVGGWNGGSLAKTRSQSVAGPRTRREGTRVCQHRLAQHRLRTAWAMRSRCRFSECVTEQHGLSVMLQHPSWPRGWTPVLVPGSNTAVNSSSLHLLIWIFLMGIFALCMFIIHICELGFLNAIKKF